ncbi:MAG TPA: SLBB domain-containing protein [Burkholderiaceae bacterium]
MRRLASPHRRLSLLGGFALSIAAVLLQVPAHAQFGGGIPSLDATAKPGDGNASDIDFGNAGGSGSQANGVGGANSGTMRATTQLNQAGGNRGNRRDQPEPPALAASVPYEPSEFERYVQQQVDGKVRRFGSELMTDPAASLQTQDPLPSVPGDYIVRPGDEIALNIWGSADANLRLTVDRAGGISVPRVGTITVGGVRNADLANVIRRQVAHVFTNFELTANLGQVRPIRVFVGGFAQRRGSLTVNGLSSVLHVLMRAGGPSAAGSFRDIHLMRGGNEVASFDLYDLLLKGRRDADRLVQPDDVVFVGPVGKQVALLGSVNQPAIYELKSGETLDDLLHMAGGFTAVADDTRVAVERLSDRETGRVSELALPAHRTEPLQNGEIVHAFSVVSASLPKLHQNERVRIEGEVLHPGDYILPPGSRMEDALRVAGGMTSAAYPYGTDFRRESVRQAQQLNYDRALRDLETDLSKAAATTRATNAEELATQGAATTANARLLERLRQIKPTGRVVLEIEPDDKALPDLALEDGDIINIPTRNSSVGVFGSVFNTGNFLFKPGHDVQQYLRLAGGPTRDADKSSMFVIRANGSVLSARADASFWHSSDFLTAEVLPGDTVFVPEELSRSSFVQDAKDWTQILYQFGLGLAGIKALGL